MLMEHPKQRLYQLSSSLGHVPYNDPGSLLVRGMLVVTSAR